MKIKFSQLSRAWYGESTLKERSYGGNVNDEITVQVYKEDEFDAEVIFKWVTIFNEEMVKLEVFDDAWIVLDKIQDLISILSEQENGYMTVDKFVGIILALGYEDITETERDGNDDEFIYVNVR